MVQLLLRRHRSHPLLTRLGAAPARNVKAQSERLLRELVCLTLLCSSQMTGCSSRRTDLPVPAEVSAAPDRLAPSEPLLGSVHVWGLRIPDGFTVGARYARTVHLSGSRPLAAVLEALRPQLSTAAIEVTPTRVVIERAYVKQTSERRLLQVEVLREGPLTRIHLVDITPEPALRGVSEREMWERAGRNPDGTLKDPRQVL